MSTPDFSRAFDLNQLKPRADEPMFRLLYCMVCNSLEELPPFEGRPENDHLLEIAVDPHKFPSGEPHKGLLFVVPTRVWMDENARRETIKQIKGGGSKGLDEFDKDFYSSRSTFQEDAMRCYNAHNRPKDGCSDYGSDRMRLLPNTAKERAELGLVSLKDAPGPKNYLCMFCPVQSTVMTKKRMAQGVYDK